MLAMILTFHGFSCLEKDKALFPFECLIHNENYGFEFLYHSNEMINSNRSTAVPYIYPMKNLPSLDRIRWTLKATRDDSDLETVLFKSYKSNKYLCASDLHLDRTKKRRIIYLSSSFEKDACEWKLENVVNKGRDQLDGQIKNYITNIKYDEPLYAPSYFFKKDRFKRNIYLWKDKNEKLNSKKFNWIIECSNVQY
jgi:hypothetical protein